MTGHIGVSTQEVGTGKWVAVKAFYPSSEQQYERSLDLADALRALGLYSKIDEVRE
jgi:hypothetical protein